ncbi:sensor histidine kinase [Desulfurispora thermophila]|uniref:sensor histidine kinase n=1 Tax=Desulfurispora thermophila TaxID=265470 RepID=UPI0003740B8B|nr:sensor histidine kinase [Desulfurispora thermophila]
MEVDIKALDKIIKKLINVIENSQEEIYNIAENARSEYQRVREEIEFIRLEVKKTIEEVDRLEIAERKARLRLVEVSRNFKQYTEEDIKCAYEAAQSIQIELIKLREKEKTLRFKRDHLDLSLKRLQETVERAERLVSQVGMAMQLLRNDLSILSEKLGNLQDIQQLGLSIILAQEEERKRVAREIHDGPAQSMANIVMRAEFCLKLLELNPGLVKDELASLQNLVRQSLQDVRKIIFDLRPMVLDDLGLVPAVKRYLEEFKARDNINYEFVLLGQERRLDTSLEVAVFRIIQEALNNIKKHARATYVLVKLELASARINVSVKDNGCGFTPETVSPRPDGSGYGLRGIRERLQLLNGGIKIISAPGKGTEISFWVPVIDNLGG